MSYVADRERLEEVVAKIDKCKLQELRDVLTAVVEAVHDNYDDRELFEREVKEALRGAGYEPAAPDDGRDLGGDEDGDPPDPGDDDDEYI